LAVVTPKRDKHHPRLITPFSSQTPPLPVTVRSVEESQSGGRYVHTRNKS
jgi:hypothetical protein